MNALLIKEQRTETTTLLHFIVESSDGKTDVAEGTETLRDDGNAEIRDQLRAAAIARLESVHSSQLEDIRPVAGVELPDSASLGAYRDGIAATA